MPLSRRGPDVYLCDAVEHSDPRFSRIKDSPGSGGREGAKRRKVSARNGRKIIRKGRECGKGENSLCHGREMAITTAQNRQVIQEQKVRAIACFEPCCKLGKSCAKTRNNGELERE